MATSRRAEAIWREDRQIWQLGVMKDGVRRQFSSKIPGKRGKHEAERKAEDWLDAGTSDMRAADAWDTFIAYLKENKSTSVYTQAERLGRLYITPNLAARRLSKVTPATWQACIEQGAKTGLSRRSCINIRSQITAFIKYARMNRWEIERVEDGDLTIPQSAPPPKPKHALTDIEIQRVFTEDAILITAPHTHGSLIERKAHYIHAFRFYILSGLRRGELAGLKHSDINGNTLTISRNINTYNEVTHGKNDNARRSFTLTPTMKQVLADQKQYLESIGISSQWVFPDKYGERPDPNNIYDHWRTFRDQHGIQGSLHELRHTFISLTKSDLPMELLKAQVGHSSEMDTALVYGHEVDGDRERTANIIEKTINAHIKKQPSREQLLKKIIQLLRNYCEK